MAFPFRVASVDLGIAGRLMGIPFQVIGGAIKGAYRGLRFGFNARAAGDTALDLGRGLVNAAKQVSPVAAAGTVASSTAQATAQTIGATINTAARGAGRSAGAMLHPNSIVIGIEKSLDWAVGSAPGLVGKVAGEVIGTTAAGLEGGRRLFGAMFDSKIVTNKAGQKITEYAMKPWISKGAFPVAFGGFAVYGAAKASVSSSMGEIEARPMPGVINSNEPNKYRGQRQEAKLHDLENIQGLTLALHHLR